MEDSVFLFEAGELHFHHAPIVIFKLLSSLLPLVVILSLLLLV